jgi:acetyl-CoA acetyltransferase family protein
MQDVVIVEAVRTAVGRYLGALKEVEAYDLAALVLNAVVARSGVAPEQVDQVIMGQSYQNGEYVNMARMGLLTAGWPEAVPGTTVDSRCCTGLDVVRLAAAQIAAGQVDVVVAGGVESMSNAEFYLPGRVKWGVGGSRGMPRGHGDPSIWGLALYDRIQRARVMSQPEGRYGVLPSMMTWAETAATEEQISREDCDAWALSSHQKACAAWEAGAFADEIVPVPVPRPKQEPLVFERDENPRADTTLEKLARLRPVLGGVCTAGNSSSENDGAAAVLMMSAARAAKLGLTTPCQGALLRAGRRRSPPGLSDRTGGRGQGPGTGRAPIGRHGPDRNPGGLRRPGPGRFEADGGGPRRLRPGQRERIGHFPGAPHRLHRHACPGDPAARDETPRQPLRAGVHLRRRGAGHCRRFRARGLTPYPGFAITG